MTRRIVAVIALLLAAGPAAADTLLLELTGSPGLRVTGTCRLVDAAGRARDAAFDSLLPHRFELDAVAASCALSKMDERGLLRASLAAEGRVIVRIETNALYGTLAVRSDGPWGPARATRSGALLRRQVPGGPETGTGRTPTVPPLRGTTVPPLKGTTVPQPR